MANMKRGGDFEPGMDDPKRSRGPSDRFDMRVLVPSKMAGSVIGKGGQNIQKLRADYSAQVRIPDCPGPERVMAIQAADVESVVGILQTAIPFMYEQGEEDDGEERDLRLLIHQSIVGGIIGKSGQKIKDIRDQTGANIKVFSNCAPQSSDRCVQVSGSLSRLVAALHLIFDVVAGTEIKGYDNHYDPANFDAFFANEYGGYGGETGFGGRGGRGGMRGGPPRGRGNFGGPPRGRAGFGAGPFPHRGGFGGPGYGPGMGPDMDGGFGFGRGGIRGRGGFPRGGRGGGFSEGFGEDSFGGFHGGRGGGPPGGPGFGRGGAGGGGGGFPGGFGGSQAGGFEFDGGEVGGGDGGEEENTQVTIPNDLAGAIIGPGGQRIRKIRNDSKATITIDEPAPGSNERVITIAGNKKQIQTAQYLLQQSVRENSGRGVAGGGY